MAYRGRFGCPGARASRPQRACARYPRPSLLPLWAYRGRFAPKRAWGLGKRMAFPASLSHRKTAKPPEVRHALPIRMLSDSSDHPTDHAASQRGAVQRTRPPDVRNHNRQKRIPELRHRRPELHGRILRRPAATPRMALRRGRPLHALAQPDRRARFAPLRRPGRRGARCASG